MPVVPVSTSRGGLTPAQIIARARDLTQKKGTYDTSGVFLDALIEFCQEARWHWRKLEAPFTTDGSVSYDLTDTAIVSGGKEAKYFQKFVKNGVKIYQGRACSWADPVFEEDRQNELMQFADSNPSGIPCEYFIEPGSYCTIRFDRPAIAGLTVRPQYWALPNLAFDDVSNVVPLVPGYLHHMLVKGMVRKIFAYLAADGAANYAAAKKVADDDYMYFLMKAKGSRDFADGKITEFSDQQCESVQSTNA